jgi:CheY-like chemotaxis protein
MPKYNRILLIDDDEDDREIFLTALERIETNVECQAFGNAREVLDKLQEKQLITDLIFLDLNMPLMTGQQFLIEIKKIPRLKEIPIIIFSTTSHRETIKLMKDLGAMEFITKPEDFTDLVKTLKSTLN